jgi:carbonic anhydrase
VSVNEMLNRSAERAETVSKQDRSLVPRLQAVVLTCADHRVDPAHVLGLDLGDAIVLRNPGGRVTAAVIEDLLVLATIAGVEGIDADFEIVVMHHTDCGLSRLEGPEHASLLASFAGLEIPEVAALHVGDPVRAVQYDVARLRSLGILSSQTPVVGLVFDLAAGRVEQHAGSE